MVYLTSLFAIMVPLELNASTVDLPGGPPAAYRVLLDLVSMPLIVVWDGT